MEIFSAGPSGIAFVLTVSRGATAAPETWQARTVNGVPCAARPSATSSAVNDDDPATSRPLRRSTIERAQSLPDGPSRLAVTQPGLGATSVRFTVVVQVGAASAGAERTRQRIAAPTAAEIDRVIERSNAAAYPNLRRT